MKAIGARCGTGTGPTPAATSPARRPSDVVADRPDAIVAPRPDTATVELGALVEACRSGLRVVATEACPDGSAPPDAPAAPDERAALVDLLASLEALKAAASAAQARLAVRLSVAQAFVDAAAGVPRERQGAGVGAQVALARGESPHRGRALLGAAVVWTREMPCTFTALAAGALSEYRAMLLVQETACLPLATRAEVDQLVCSDPASLAGVGTRRLVAIARGHAARLDPAALVARARRATEERTVTLRPAPDTMTYLTALLPVAQGVAALASLQRAADAARASGDPRARGQVMADTLVEHVTGQPHADAVPVTVSLVLSDATLLGAGHDDAVLDGYGRVPAQVARNLVAHGLDADATWVRRVYADPDGDLVALSSTRRFHPEGLATMLRIRDQGLCRTPYCDAPIRHLDHVAPHADGGPTDLANGQGLCEACNHVKQLPGWRQEVAGRSAPWPTSPTSARAPSAGTPPAAPPAPVRHRVLTTTPTGHSYASTAPQPPRPLPAAPVGGYQTLVPDPPWTSPIDLAFAAIIEHLLDDGPVR